MGQEAYAQDITTLSQRSQVSRHLNLIVAVTNTVAPFDRSQVKIMFYPSRYGYRRRERL